MIKVVVLVIKIKVFLKEARTLVLFYKLSNGLFVYKYNLPLTKEIDAP